MLDARGLETTAANDAAVRNLDATLAQYLRFGTATGDLLKRTLAEDPEMVLAHCVKGYFFMLFCIPALVVKARASLDAGRRSAGERGATDRERRHLDALDAWIRGEFEQAAAHLEAILADHPRDILALRLAHYLHFYLGDDENLRDSIGRVLHAWDDTVDGYGYVLGMHAFALEEWGACDEAERAGRSAVERNPADLWAVHAVAHVMEMQDRRREGVAWIRESEPRLGECNNFGYHLWWHLALFHLELEDTGAVLRLYDERMRADLSDEYLDICNATSMLWRLEERGVDVGDRWNELAERCEARTGDHQLVFADVHYMLALAAGGRDAAAGRMLGHMSAFAEGPATEQAVDALGRYSPRTGHRALVPRRVRTGRRRARAGPLPAAAHRGLARAAGSVPPAPHRRRPGVRPARDRPCHAERARRPQAAQSVDVEALRAGAGRARRRRGRGPGAGDRGPPPDRVEHRPLVHDISCKAAKRRFVTFGSPLPRNDGKWSPECLPSFPRSSVPAKERHKRLKRRRRRGALPR